MWLDGYSTSWETITPLENITKDAREQLIGLTEIPAGWNVRIRMRSLLVLSRMFRATK